MRRFVWFAIKLAVLLAFTMWVIGHSGKAHLIWHGYAIETSSAFIGLVVLALSYVLFTLHRFWRLFRSGPEMYRLKRKIAKLHEGHAHLTHGLVAVAAGHAPEAGRRALGARKILGVTVGTQLLQAQAAQLAGDHKVAAQLFMSLASKPESAVLGYRGLIMEAFRMRQWEEAERLMNELRETHPKTPWLNAIGFELAARQRRWQDAAMLLSEISAGGLVDPSKVKRHEAAAHLAASGEEESKGHQAIALQEAERALQLAPTWIPAILGLSAIQAARGHERAARRTIEAAWRVNPHPQLARLYRDCGNGDAMKSYKRVSYLCKGNEERPMSRMALAEAALAADIWGEARRHLQILDNSQKATQSTYRLLAKLERCETGSEHEALQWLSKALDAPLDPVWICSSCGGGDENWQATCRHCKSFNTLDWQIPLVSRGNTNDTTLFLTSASAT